MTFQSVRFRLMIEGWPDEWVTDHSLELTLADTRVRRQGLCFDRLELKEKLDLREGIVKPGSMTFTIRSEFAMASFATRATPITQITDTAVTYAATAFEVLNAGDISAGDIIHVGTEAIAVGASDGTTTLDPVLRQAWDTQAQGHYAKSSSIEESVYVFNRPPTMEGRRAYLFMYQAGDTSDESSLYDFTTDYQGSAVDTADTLIWRGVVSQHPVLASDGVSWNIHCEPITMLLEQEVAAMADKRTPIAGIYHSYADCFTIKIYQSGASPEDSTYKITGFFADEDEFVTEVNSKFATWLGGVAVDPPAVLRMSSRATPGTGFHTIVMTGAPNGNNPWVRVYSSQEGVFEGYWWLDTTLNLMEKAASLISGRLYSAELATAPNLPLGTANQAAPRNGFGLAQGPWSPLWQHLVDQSAASDYPLHRIYFAGDLGLAANDEVIVRTKDHNGDDIKIEGTVTATDALGREYIDISTPLSPYEYFILTDGTTIEPRRAYVEAGNLGDFIEAIVDNAIYANKGDTPFITWADFDLKIGTYARSMVNQQAASLGDWGTRRFIYAQPETVLDIVREEMKLLGVFMRLTDAGKMTLAELVPPASTDLEAIVLTDTSDIVTPYDSYGMWPSWEPDREGIVGTVEITPSYNIETAEAEGKVHRVRNVATISKYKNRGRGVIQINPRSNLYDDTTRANIMLDESTAVLVARRLFAMHSEQYNVVKMKCRLGLFNAAVDGMSVAQSLRAGDNVVITSSHVIDASDGARGVSRLPGIVLDTAYPLTGKSAECTISVRVRTNDAAAYAPAARITSAVSAGSNTVWDITLTENMFAPTAMDDGDYFKAGDRIMVWEYNATSPGYEDGVITTKTSATSMRITLDAAAPWGAGGSITYDLTYDIDDGNLQSAQYDYAFVADNDGSRVTGNADEFV